MDKERIQRETIKQLLKQAVYNNPNLTQMQKQLVSENIDRAAIQTDWIITMMKMCGYLK